MSLKFVLCDFGWWSCSKPTPTVTETPQSPGLRGELKGEDTGPALSKKDTQTHISTHDNSQSEERPAHVFCAVDVLLFSAAVRRGSTEETEEVKWFGFEAEKLSITARPVLHVDSGRRPRCFF